MERYIKLEDAIEVCGKYKDLHKKENSRLGMSIVNDIYLDIDNLPTADVVEVKHGRWHIMSDDLTDESECPTEEGWYRIITTDGEEMTDYFFNKPTLIGMGCVYWKNCKKGIMAWAKMDGGKEE